MDLELLKTSPSSLSSVDHHHYPGMTKAGAREIKDLDTQLKWADAFILVYSVTDKCSFDECNRLKFLINYHKRRRKLTNHKVRKYGHSFNLWIDSSFLFRTPWLTFPWY